MIVDLMILAFLGDIGGLKNWSLRADPVINRQTSTWLSNITLYNDATYNSLWRNTSDLTLRANDNSSRDRKRKETAFL
jgi:hypothetical protein